MYSKYKNKISPFFLAVYFILLSFSLQFNDVAASENGAKKIRVAIFPFNDMQAESLDTGLPSILKARLSGYEFIDTVPVEIIKEEIYEIQPSSVWTKREGKTDSAGIIWRIEPNVIEEVQKKVPADYSVYGDLKRFGKTWTVVVHIMKERETGIKKSFIRNSLIEEKIPERMLEISMEIAEWLKGENIVSEAEEVMRKYLGGLYTHSVALEKIKNLSNYYSGSIPLHALLLELYLARKDNYAEKILAESSRIIDIYDPLNDDDTRYLLSMNIDPFETAADIYETRGDWKEAISIRHLAEKKFPYSTERHMEMLGKDYYFYAVSFEKNGNNARAEKNYGKAMIYLKPSSAYYHNAKDGYDVLKRKRESSN